MIFLTFNYLKNRRISKMWLIRSNRIDNRNPNLSNLRQCIRIEKAESCQVPLNEKYISLVLKYKITLWRGAKDIPFFWKAHDMFRQYTKHGSSLSVIEYSTIVKGIECFYDWWKGWWFELFLFQRCGCNPLIASVISYEIFH